MTDDAQKNGPLQSLFTGNPSRSTEAGDRGECWAGRFLIRDRGYRIVARNWRNPRDLREEIDLVAQDGEVLVFVEVKARSEAARVPGFFAIDRRKRAALRRAIRAYLQALRPRPRTFRLDVVEVTLTGGAPVILHFENVGLFPKYFRGG